MNGWIGWLNATSATWADRFWMATWQAVIVIAIAWLLTTLLRRLSPRVRCWIWRLAYVKILLSLFWTTPIELALLPAVEGRGSRIEGREVADAGISGQGSVVREEESKIRRDASNGPLPADTTTSVARPESANGVEQPSRVKTTPIAEPQGVPPAEDKTASAPLVWQSYLLAIWLVGLLAVIAWLAMDTLRAAKLLHHSRPLDDANWRALSDDVCRRLGLSRTINLRSSPTARSPVLIRFIRPAIILPQGMLGSSSLTGTLQQISPSPWTGEGRGEGDEARPSANPTTQPSALTQSDLALAIAHEAAHLRRHDLAWNALATIVHVAMYFHPLVWLAHRQIRLQQEMACDELVLQKLSAAPQDYGRMLVNVVRRLAAV